MFWRGVWPVIRVRGIDMTDVKGPYRVGAFFILMSAVFHVLAPIWGGFSGFAGMLVPLGLEREMPALRPPRGRACDLGSQDHFGG